MSVGELFRRKHLGLIGMKEWAKIVNGKLLLRQNEPSGLTVLLEVPVSIDASYK